MQLGVATKNKACLLVPHWCCPVFPGSSGSLLPGPVDGSHQGLLLLQQGPLDLQDFVHVLLLQLGRRLMQVVILQGTGVSSDVIDDVIAGSGQTLAPGATAKPLIEGPAKKNTIQKYNQKYNL